MKRKWILTFRSIDDAFDNVNSLSGDTYKNYYTDAYEVIYKSRNMTENDIWKKFNAWNEIESIQEFTKDKDKYLNYGTSDKYEKIWPSGLFSDVQLCVGDNVFKVHKSILACKSDYFLTLFTTSVGENKNEITINDVDDDTFTLLLNYIYEKEIEIKDIHIINLLIMFDRFQINGVDYLDIINRIPLDNIIDNHIEFINLLEKLYPCGFNEDINNLIKYSIPVQADLSIFSSELQSTLKM